MTSLAKALFVALAWARNAQLLHAGPQGVRVDIEHISSITGTIDLPSTGFADQADVYALNFIEGLPFKRDEIRQVVRYCQYALRTIARVAQDESRSW